jgi:adenylate cyclase
LIAVERGKLSEASFRSRYVHRKAILVLDITGFTESGLTNGEINAFLRILGMHKICDPILRNHDATLLRAFADDLVALFDSPTSALDAAFAVHAEVDRYQTRPDSFTASWGIGIGYGDVFAIGPNLAMGNEMNQASKLGEDTAEAGETLLTMGAYRAVQHRTDVHFVEQAAGSLPFPYMSATLKA